MKISSTSYNADGQLLMPTTLDVKLTRALPNTDISIDAGFYHLAKIEGRTPRELDATRERFVDVLRTAPLCTVLETREYKVQMDSFVRYGLQLLYVVELPVEQRAAHAAARAGIRRYDAGY